MRWQFCFWCSDKTVVKWTCPNFATNMSSIRCPKCSYSRLWKLRRNKCKCKRCRAEFSPGRPAVPGIRLGSDRVLRAAGAFLDLRTVRAVAESCGTSRSTAEKLCRAFRLAMATDVPPPFAGPVEVDETYIGGQRKNQRLHIRRRYPPKRGHGTRKTPIIGARDRATGRVRVEVMARKLDKSLVLDFVSRAALPGALVYTDGFPYYRDLAGLGYRHEWIDHNAGEYVRGDVHTNGIEGFWGFMKRQMGTTGGMRRDRLGLFAAEHAWRYNHSRVRKTRKAELLFGLVTEFGGKS